MKTREVNEQEVVVLKDVNLDINEGDFLSLLDLGGGEGTHLLNIIGCLDLPTRGEVYFDEKNLNELNENEVTKLRLANIGFIFKQPFLIPTLNVKENVELLMKEAKVGKEEREKRIMALLEAVGLSSKADYYPGQLTANEVKSVSVARALANNPRIIITNDAKGEMSNGETIMDFLRKINKETGVAVVLATNDTDVVNETEKAILIKTDKTVVEKQT
ncbi:MAG: ATP-binding cassette domain-containing protein [Candidatus Thermoplasmatota archaeon]